ncbi:hypothetical protein [Hyphomicrobium sp.]|uniref:hypothetical protein n=1 Tax=Hyphomicrobium sp. TaxID=82 RepID=UPI003F6E6907
MPLHRLSEDELRSHCKRIVEALELWLRRLIHVNLSETYGSDYLHAIKSNGVDRVIRTDIAKRLEDAVAREPARYSRPIDAALLDDEIDIVCNPELYRAHFAQALGVTYPSSQELRAVLSRLVTPRNSLYHANPISHHDAYRIFCYAHDVIGEVQKYFARRNMDRQFNAPSIIRISDSRGDARHFPVDDKMGSAMMDLSQDPAAILYSGDTISVEVEVDAAFDPEEYSIRWMLSNIGGEIGTGSKFTLELTDRHVSTRLCIVCRIDSKSPWHRFGTHDDQGEIAYRVLPRP